MTGVECRYPGGHVRVRREISGGEVREVCIDCNALLSSQPFSYTPLPPHLHIEQATQEHKDKIRRLKVPYATIVLTPDGAARDANEVGPNNIVGGWDKAEEDVLVHIHPDGGAQMMHSLNRYLVELTRGGKERLDKERYGARADNEEGEINDKLVLIAGSDYEVWTEEPTLEDLSRVMDMDCSDLGEYIKFVEMK